MNQYAAPTVQALLNKGIAGGEMLDDVVVSHVINGDDLVAEIRKEMGIERQAQGGEYMRDVRVSQGFFARKGDKSLIGCAGGTGDTLARDFRGRGSCSRSCSWFFLWSVKDLCRNGNGNGI